jgi:hypothetical protein
MLHEARYRPPRCVAWLRNSMVSKSKSGFNLRESQPLSRNILYTCGIMTCEYTGQQTNSMKAASSESYQIWEFQIFRIRVVISHLNYLITVWDTAKSGIGCQFNRHLNYFVETINGNVRDSQRMQRRAVLQCLVTTNCESRSIHSTHLENRKRPKVSTLRPDQGERESRFTGGGNAVRREFLSKGNRMLTGRNLL